MNCDDFEQLLADALGNELAEEDRPIWEAHLGTCASCRKEYETLCQSLMAMGKLTGPQGVALDPEVGKHMARMRIDRPLAGRRFMGVGMLRYAAGLLLSFTAGYVFHAALLLSRPAGSEPPSRPQARVVSNKGVQTNLYTALAGTHRLNPNRSDLAKCMIAMFGAKSN